MCTQWQVEHQRCSSRACRVQKNHKILRKNTIFNEHPVAGDVNCYRLLPSLPPSVRYNSQLAERLSLLASTFPLNPSPNKLGWAGERLNPEQTNKEFSGYLTLTVLPTSTLRVLTKNLRVFFIKNFQYFAYSAIIGRSGK